MAEDITIPITVKKENVQEFLPNFLAYKPVPVDSEGNPTMTTKEHIRRRIVESLLLDCRRGQDILALAANESLENLIE